MKLKQRKYYVSIKWIDMHSVRQSVMLYISVNNGNRETFGFEEQNEILWLSMAKLVLYCIR